MSTMKEILHKKKRSNWKTYQAASARGKTKCPLYCYDARYSISGIRVVQWCWLNRTSDSMNYLLLQKWFHHVLDYIALIALAGVVVGGFLNFAFGLPIYLSFKKGIFYGVK